MVTVIWESQQVEMFFSCILEQSVGWAENKHVQHFHQQKPNTLLCQTAGKKRDGCVRYCLNWDIVLRNQLSSTKQHRSYKFGVQTKTHKTHWDQVSFCTRTGRARSNTSTILPNSQNDCWCDDEVVLTDTLWILTSKLGSNIIWQGREWWECQIIYQMGQTSRNNYYCPERLRNNYATLPPSASHVRLQNMEVVVV